MRKQIILLLALIVALTLMAQAQGNGRGRGSSGGTTVNVDINSGHARDGWRHDRDDDHWRHGHDFDDDDRPPGWSRGRKVGWRGCDLPPGQAKKYGCYRRHSHHVAVYHDGARRSGTTVDVHIRH